ncbi:hypothetical protein [Bradyrhizobium iriomotense]|nr:hypothetical protein [Bradyrhizobium iriomotense]
MPSVVFKIAAVAAGLSIMATTLVLPRPGLKGLAKGMAAAISLTLAAAFLIATVRSFGP